MAVRIIRGDCREALRELPDCFRVNCCVTSPPYFGLRDYGHAGQIGLEPTQDEYVATLVDVFREVRRVLRDDGTVWLNLGDSYAAGGSGGYGTASTLSGYTSENTKHRKAYATAITRKPTGGLKPKDLIGIPWRVAFALQQPYYAGRIKREIDRVWLAAMVDGEGCFYVHRRQAGGHSGDGYVRKTDTYSPAFEVANTHKAIVDRCLEIAGVGSVIRQEKDRRQPLWRWTVRASEAKAIACEIYPYLVGKRQQCRIICGMPANGESASAAWSAIKLLHAGSSTDVDFSEPESMHQPGYYLRSDVIWAKPNPMPESVTDRPTKAHEYVFLLAKSERYYYNAAAIAEPSEGRELFGNKRAKGYCEQRQDNDRRDMTLTETRNRRTVWTVATQPFSGAHFATFPPALIEPCILAGCPEGGTVLDPFGGAGTTGLVADRLGRNALLIELNPAYADMAQERIRGESPMFAEVSGG